MTNIGWKEWVTKRAPEVNYNARVLFRELREQGYQGSYDTVKVFDRFGFLRPCGT